MLSKSFACKEEERRKKLKASLDRGFEVVLVIF